MSAYLTRLLNNLHRIFDKDPERVLALRLGYDGPMSWRVEDGVLTTQIAGGTGADLLIDLNGHTIASLADHVAAQPGYAVLYRSPDLGERSALVLIDAAGSPKQSNGDHLYAYTSVLHAILHSAALELQGLKTAILSMLRQMNMLEAEGEWLDEWGARFGVMRNPGEADTIYAERIVRDTLRPRCNNVAIEQAIALASGGLSATVLDAPPATVRAPLRTGMLRYDGSHAHTVSTVSRYFEFDVAADYDLLSGDDIAALTGRINLVVEAFRAAGTRMRTVDLRGELADTMTQSEEFASSAIAEFSDQFARRGGRRHDGSFTRNASMANRYDRTLTRLSGIDRSGVRLAADPPRYDTSDDAYAAVADVSWSDRFRVQVRYDRFARRDGAVTRSGYVGAPLEAMGITVTRTYRRDGTHDRGSSRPTRAAGIRYDGRASRLSGRIQYRVDVAQEAI